MSPGSHRLLLPFLGVLAGAGISFWPVATAAAAFLVMPRTPLVRAMAAAVTLMALTMGSARLAAHHQLRGGPAVCAGRLAQGILTGRCFQGERWHYARIRLQPRSGTRGTVVVRGDIRPPNPPRVPGLADERSLARSGAYHALVDGRPTLLAGPRRAPLLVRRHERVFADMDRLGVVRAMTTGDRSAMPYALVERFRRAGLAHVLAISGFHLAIVGLAAFSVLGPLLARLGIAAAARVRTRAAATILLMAVYAGLTGGSTATIRAALMGALVLSRAAAGRAGYAPVQTLLLAGIALGVLAPGQVWSPGFLLSFGAVYGLISDAGATRSGPVLSLVAVLFTAPASAYFFARITPVSVLSNLAGGPLAGLLMTSSLLSHLPGAGVAAFAAEAAAGLLVLVADVAARTPDLTVSAGRALFLIPALLLGRIPGTRAGRRWTTGALMTLVLLFPRSRAPLEVWFLDVGQGDAILIQTPGRKRLLVDSGPPGGRYAVGAALRHVAPDGVDMYLETHTHRDHIAGSDLTGRPPHRPRAGSQLRIDPQIRLFVLGPEAGLRDANERSLVLLLVHGAHRFLLTGDIEGASESSLVLRWDTLLRADVVKMPHHGSDSSSHRFFVHRVAGVFDAEPRWAVVSVGSQNRFGLPDVHVLDRWRNAGYQVLSTAREGSVYCRSTGRRLHCRPFNPDRD